MRCLIFVFFYFEPHVETQLNRPTKNDDGGVIENDGRLLIFVHLGRLPNIKRKNDRYLEDNEWMTAHRCVLYNCEEIQPFIE
ncbi:hypothetical protein CDL12_22804 [Handroanthus impetiginosus]|uniref:Uncharacterized protein n=1 Tax=Handroanthus impetiginosus TaxID=429701 RepID=A0A2G9GH96_9LAMI|nr:hypothetical protein CDL12_22804 [Handroanthus impetiginosus]